MRTRRIAFASVLAACAAAVPAAPAMAADSVTVMTRNIYLGADIIGLATARDEDAFKANATKMFKIVEATNFPERAKGLAKEVKTTKPDLIGLQEAALWRTGSLSSSAKPTKVKYDFVKELDAALKKQGQNYTVVVSKEEFDFTGPTETEKVRLTMRDVILRRNNSKVKVSKPSSGHYTKIFEVETPVGLAKSKRGWVAVDARLGKKRFRFVNTHLEAYDVPKGIRKAQAAQLVGSSGPLANRAVPALLVGDFNSDPAQKGTSGDAFRVFTGAGFADVYGSKRALTFGQDELLAKKKPFTDFIDHVMHRGSGWKVAGKQVVGTKPFRSKAPLWASDHAGLVAKLRIK